jgi:hypothetical protein
MFEPSLSPNHVAFTLDSIDMLVGYLMSDADLDERAFALRTILVGAEYEDVIATMTIMVLKSLLEDGIDATQAIVDEAASNLL